jgi:hypothetical protein
MAEKKSVYLADETIKIVGLVGDSLSGRINAIVSLYDEIIRREAPEFTFAEWSAICDANNGTLFDDASSRTWMWANVADSRGLGEKWEIDATKLVDKMRSLSFVQSIAMAEICQRFWSDCSRRDNEKWLKECGAKIKKFCDKCGSPAKVDHENGTSFECGSWEKPDGSKSHSKLCFQKAKELN